MTDALLAAEFAGTLPGDYCLTCWLPITATSTAGQRALGVCSSTCERQLDYLWGVFQKSPAAQEPGRFGDDATAGAARYFMHNLQAQVDWRRNRGMWMFPRRRTQHSISPDQKDALLNLHDGGCWVCRKPFMAFKSARADRDTIRCFAKEGHPDCVRGYLCLRCWNLVRRFPTATAMRERAAAAQVKSLGFETPDANSAPKLLAAAADYLDAYEQRLDDGKTLLDLLEPEGGAPQAASMVSDSRAFGEIVSQPN
jgi:hypothetical protein